MEQALERGALYVVGTPIGNLGDFSPRARETLEAADFIAAEDTRVTLRLLNHFGIKKPLISYFEHNKLEHGPLIVARLQEGPDLRVGVRRGDARHLRPGGDLGGRLRRRGAAGVRGARAHGGPLRLGHQRAAHRAVYL